MLKLTTADPEEISVVGRWHKVVDPACAIAGHQLPKGSKVLKCARLEAATGGIVSACPS